MKTTLYNYKDYKKYLIDQCAERAKSERGPKARLAEFVGCHLAYLSQVLNGSAHLSAEQADGCNRFFGHTKGESLFFLTLVHYAKAGTEPLKQFYLGQIKDMLEEQALLKNRLELKKTHSPETQAIYYSSWEYLATHIAVSIPGIQTKAEIANALGLSLERTAEVLDFLLKTGLVKQSKGKYDITESGFHLGAGSPFLVKHHTNWRVQSLRSLDQMKPEDVHYSSVISCNRDDVAKIKDTILSAIQQIREIVKDSENADCLMSYCLDLFPVTRRL